MADNKNKHYVHLDMEGNEMQVDIDASTEKIEIMLIGLFAIRPDCFRPIFKIVADNIEKLTPAKTGIGIRGGLNATKS